MNPSARASILKKAILTRCAETFLLDLYRQGKAHGTVHTCIGQELVGAVVSEFLRPEDRVFSNHRGHGHFLSVTGNVEGLLAEVMGKATGVSRGLGGSQHLKQSGFYSNGIQGGIVPVSAGLAMALKRKGTPAIAVVFIGDGTLGEGVLYETLNLVSLWKLPLLFVLENNGYAQSTAQKETLAGEILKRPEAFGIKTFEGNTWKWETLYGNVESAVIHVRETREPVFLEVQTYRLSAHSKGDDDRSPEEILSYEQKDPLTLLKKETEEIFQKTKDQVQEAFEKANSACIPSLAPTFEVAPVQWSRTSSSTKEKTSKQLNTLFKNQMALQKEILFIGEDVRSPYGGAFKVSDELSTLFSDRVLNTPISEATLVGLGTGLAMEGFRPFIEIMFGDFLGLAFDQIANHAAKFVGMYGEKLSIPLVIRAPMGGYRGYGPTHSQCLEKHFLGIPGLQVVVPNGCLVQAEFYKPLFETQNPNLVIENKSLYSQSTPCELPHGFTLLKSNDTFPTVWIRPEAAEVDITLVSYGGMASLLIEAADRLFEEYDWIAQVILPSQIYPFTLKSFWETIKPTPYLLVVEEGQGFSGFGAEVIAQVNLINSSVKTSRVFAKPQPIPSSFGLEKLTLPSVGQIIETARNLLEGKTK